MCGRLRSRVSGSIHPCGYFAGLLFHCGPILPKPGPGEREEESTVMAALSYGRCPISHYTSCSPSAVEAASVFPRARVTLLPPALAATAGASSFIWQEAGVSLCSRRRWPGAGMVTVISMSSSKTSSCIQFIRGIDEQTVPDVKLTRSRDGSSGVATFVFDQPSVFDSSRELGEITGLYMVDDEGILSSVDVSARFVNGKPARIEAKYVMRNVREWDRFMRFMERYANENNLGFVKT